MKIGFDDTPAAPAGTYSQHLARLLAEYAPEHEYIIDGKRCKEFDLYHGFRPGLPFPVLLRRIPCVMTVHNLNFLRYPHLYSLGERLVLLRLYRRMLRSASRVITVNRDARGGAFGPAADRPRQDRGRDAARGAYAAESARRRRAGRRAAQICSAARFRADAGDGRAAPQSGGAVRGAGPAPGAGARDARNERGGDAGGSGTD